MLRTILIAVLLVSVTTGAALAELVSVTGSVVDERGAGVENAEVWVVRNSYLPQEAVLVAEGQTDAQGNFSLPDVEFIHREPNSFLAVGAYRSGLALGGQVLHRGPEDLKIVLGTPLKVTGQVCTDGGEGIAAVKVRPSLTYKIVRSSSHEETLILPEVIKERLAVACDIEGNFTLPWVPPNVRVLVELLVPGYIETWTGVHPSDYDDTWVIRYPPAGTIEGRVVCEEAPQHTGEVVIELVARLEGGVFVRTQATTNAQGHFRWAGLPAGSYDLTVGLGAQSPWQPLDKETVEVPAGAVADIQIALHKATPVKGRVVEQDTNLPVSGAAVVLHTVTGRDAPNTVITDEDGNYLIHALPGKHYVKLSRVPEEYVRAKDQSGSGKTIIVETAEMVVPDIEIRRGATIRGVVVDNERRLVPWAELFCIPGRFWERTELANQQGVFVIKQLEPDKPVRLHAQAGELLARGEVALTPGQQDEPLVLTVYPYVGATLTGTVVDDSGQPMPDVLVRLYWHGEDWGKSAGVVRADAQGRFRSLPQAPLYSYYSTVEAQGYSEGRSEKWTATPGSTHEFSHIVMRSTEAVISGRVVDSGGRPIRDATVYNRGDSTQDLTTTSDVEGRFSLGGFFPGRVWVFAEAEGYRFGGTPTAANAEDVMITLRSVDGPLELGQPWTVPEPTPTDLARDHQIAQQLVSEALATIDELEGEERRLVDYWYGHFLKRLALIDPQQAFDISAQLGGGYDDAIRRALDPNRIQEQPQEVLERLQKISNPVTRTSRLVGAAEQLRDTRPEIAEQILLDVIEKGLELDETMHQVYAMARGAEALLSISPERAAQYLRRAAEMAQDLPTEGWNTFARGTAARALACIDVSAALELIEPLRGVDTRDPRDPPDPGSEYRRYSKSIAYRVAATDPPLAEELLGRLDESQYEYAWSMPAICYRMAPQDPERAIRLATTWEPPALYRPTKAVAITCVAHALAPHHPETAVEMVEQAVHELVSMRVAPGYGDQFLARTNARLLSAATIVVHLSAEFGYPRIDELVLRALSLRPSELGARMGGDKAEASAGLALGLAFVAPEIAGDILQQCPPLSQAPLHQPGYVEDLVATAVILDPETAARMLAEVSQVGSDPAFPPQLKAYLRVVDYLTAPADQRRGKFIEWHHFWVPGKDVK